MKQFFFAQLGLKFLENEYLSNRPTKLGDFFQCKLSTENLSQFLTVLL